VSAFGSRVVVDESLRAEIGCMGAALETRFSNLAPIRGAVLCGRSPQRSVPKKGAMSKPRVDFKYKRIAEDDWQIEAHYAGAEIRYIKPFKSKAEIDEWLQGTGRVDWLRSQGYAK